MGVVIIKDKLTKEDVRIALEDHGHFDYIKITIDIENEVIAIGGEYHYDAEQILIKQFRSKNSKTWGGGYNIKTKVIRTDAFLNHKPNFDNPSSEIIIPDIRNSFLKLAKGIAKEIDSFV
jgi:hypothetical protein